MNKRNYQRELEKIIDEIPAGQRPRLLLHSCCAPCSSYVIEYLSRYFDICLYYYNPNISPEDEYIKRSEELKRLVGSMDTEGAVEVKVAPYEPEEFYSMAKGLEHEPEGGARCMGCYELRLRKTAEYMLSVEGTEEAYDFFATTLSISPLKNAEALNSIGEAVAREYGLRYLVSDFKKKNGYKRSVELSEKYGLYRQDYCGCVFSKRPAS
ncbi:MAG: epoxyqueuosine reductase QueH [Candidatus Avilachnospira sp.]|jgi:predicted adenine nucleotide alpha hydrolase (AANH) superfamily ATPase